MWRRLIGNSVQTPHYHVQPLVLIPHCFAPFGSSPCSNTCCHSNILCGCTDIPTVWSAVVAWMLNKFRSLITSVHFYQTAKLSKCTMVLWIRLVGHVARVVIGETGTELLLENVKERDYSEGLDVDGSTIFKMTLRKSDGTDWVTFTCFRIYACWDSQSFCEHWRWEIRVLFPGFEPEA
jgi:hypothetical protein